MTQFAGQRTHSPPPPAPVTHSTAGLCLEREPETGVGVGLKVGGVPGVRIPE